MLRAVLTILIALPMLVPQGMCLRKFDCMGWLLRTPTTATSPVRTERAESRHPTTCGCGCQERAARHDDATGGDSTSVGDDRVLNGTPPSEPQGPCCPTICKAKLDKFVQVENPEPVAVAVFVGIAPAPATHACTPPPARVHPTSHAPPLYIAYCTFLI